VRDVEHFRDVERPKGAERRRNCGTTAHLRVDFRRAPTGCRDGPLPTKGRAVDPEAADVDLAPRRDGRHRSRDGHYRVRLFARRRRIRRKVHDGRPQGLCVNAQLWVIRPLRTTPGRHERTRAQRMSRTHFTSIHAGVQEAAVRQRRPLDSVVGRRQGAACRSDR